MAGNADWVTASDVLVQGTATPGDFKDTNGAANDGSAIRIRHENGELIIEGTDRQLARLGARILGYAVRNHTGSTAAHGNVVDAIEKILDLVIVEE